MNYTFKGKLQGLICSECLEPLSNVKVRLYKTRNNKQNEGEKEKEVHNEREKQ